MISDLEFKDLHKIEDQIYYLYKSKVIQQSKLSNLLYSILYKFQTNLSQNKEKCCQFWEKLNSNLEYNQLKFTQAIQLIYNLNVAKPMRYQNAYNQILNSLFLRIDQILRNTDTLEQTKDGYLMIKGRDCNRLGKIITVFGGYPQLLKTLVMNISRILEDNDINEKKQIQIIFKSIETIFNCAKVVNIDAQSKGVTYSLVQNREELINQNLKYLGIENVLPLMEYLLQHFQCIKDKYVFNLYLILVKLQGFQLDAASKQEQFSQVFSKLLKKAQTYFIQNKNLVHPLMVMNLIVTDKVHFKDKSVQVWNVLIQKYIESYSRKQEFYQRHQQMLIIKSFSWLGLQVSDQNEKEQKIDFDSLCQILVNRYKMIQTYVDNKIVIQTLRPLIYMLSKYGKVQQLKKLLESLQPRVLSFNQQDIYTVLTIFQNLDNEEISSSSEYQKLAIKLLKLIQSSQIINTASQDLFLKVMILLNSLNSNEFSGLNNFVLHWFSYKYSKVTHPALFVKVMRGLSQKNITYDKLWISGQTKIFTALNQFTVEQLCELLLVYGSVNRGSYFLWQSFMVKLTPHLKKDKNIFASVFLAHSANLFKFHQFRVMLEKQIPFYEKQFLGIQS